MNTEIGSYEAKTKLPEILRQVEKTGVTFTITNRGKPIADISPSRAGSKLRTQAAIANILKAKKHVVSDFGLQSLKTEGRR